MKISKINKITLGILSIVALTSCGEKKNSTSKQESSKYSTLNSSSSNTDKNSTSKKEETVTKYTITFSLNYTGASTYKTVEVEAGETVSKPSDPTRSGYIFNGWFEDSDCLSLYNFSTAVTSDITLYANWLEGDAADYVQVTFYYNYDGAPDNGVFYTSNIKKKRKVTKPTNPTRDEYYFDAWYTDSNLTTKFDFTSILSDSTSVYAGWKKLYTFEAEDTDFDGKNGFGYSANVSETEMIEEDDGSLLASNGHFVSYLYYNGAFLEWKFTASEACDNVTFITRLSAEFFDINVSPSTYDMTVNGTSLTGYDIALTGIEGTMKKLPFTDYVISSTVSLVKGENTIKMITKNNNSHPSAGTYHAEAPMIDCIKLATNETLTFNKIEGNY